MKKFFILILVFSSLFLFTPKVTYAACSVVSGVTTANGFTDCVNELVVNTVMPIMGKFLQLTAYLFDYALMLNMNIAQYLQNPACTSGADCAISPVEIVWRMIRDISGMFFIFVLIWSSIRMILGWESGSNKRVIVGVVMAGLLVNFSLFGAKIVIDASNALTLTIYDAITPIRSKGIVNSLGGTDKNGQIAGGISSIIMEVVDLQSLMASTKQATKDNFNVTSIVIVVGGAALMLVLGIAFLAAGIMFLWRLVILLYLLAISPVPALAYAFPSIPFGKNYIPDLIGQCLFAPIFLFYIYMALKILTNPYFISLYGDPNKNSFSNLLSGVGGNLAPIIQYGLVIFVIFMGLVAAKGHGAKGGEFGVSWIKAMGKWGQGAVTGAVVGTGAFAWRNTGSMISNKLAESDALKTAASKSTIAALGLKTFRSVGANYASNVEKKSAARVKFAESLGYNKDITGDLEEEILKLQNTNGELTLLRDNPTSTDGDKSYAKRMIKENEEKIRSIKSKVGQEKLRRQQNVARRDDPRLDLRTGKTKGMSALQRLNRFGFISEPDEKSTAELGVKSIEAAIKEKEEGLKKLNEKRDDAKKDLKKRENELKKDGIPKDKFKDDKIYAEAQEELYKVLRGEKNADGKYEGGIIDHDAELRELKANLAKLK